MLREHLARYTLSQVLLALAQVAGLLKTWQNETDHKADRDLTNELLPSHRAAINSFRDDTHVVFARISLLYVARQACIVCGQAEGLPGQLSSGDLESIFCCCLMANDLIVERRAPRVSTTIEKAAASLPLANYIPHNTYPRDIARNLLIFEEIAPLLQGASGYRDVAVDFAHATGVTPREFCELAFTASLKFFKELKAGDSFVLKPSYLQHSSVAPEHVQSFFARSSATPVDLQALVRSQENLGSDFLAFQRYPLVQISEVDYVCPDPAFLLDKCGKSLYWTLHDAQPGNQRHSLLTYWSALIERYVHWLFAQTYQGRGTVMPSPRFSNGDEAFDLMLVEGSCLIVIEVKASILTVQSKYGFSPQTLGEELHRKAITGEEGERKGVAQLHENLRRLLDGDEIEGLDRGAIKTIYPALVFLDHSFTSPYLHQLYNEHFDRDALRRRPKRTITPVYSLTLDDLENSLPYTDKFSFSEILDSYWRNNRDRPAERRQFQVPILDGKQPGKNVVRERFNKFGHDFHNTRFPDTPLEFETPKRTLTP
jgi:hypothetical protein